MADVNELEESDFDELNFELLELRPQGTVVPYQFEPVAQRQIDEIEHRGEEVREYLPLVSEWCGCHHCQDQPTREQSVCCRNKPEVLQRIEPLGLDCITLHEGVHDLLKDAPLELMYNNYCLYHDDIFPENPTPEERQAKKRFCAYRSLVFWLYPNIRRGQRIPLSACLYGLVQAKFPPSDDEEVFADHVFSEFFFN